MTQSTDEANITPPEHMLNQAYDLTFGVELEFVFVFHEKLILGQFKKDWPHASAGGGVPLHKGQLLEGGELNKWRDTILQKNPSYNARRSLRQGPSKYVNDRQFYDSWAVKVHTPWRGWKAHNERLNPLADGVHVCTPKGRPVGPLDERLFSSPERPLRTYYTEPLEVAKEVLRTEGIFPYWSGNGGWEVDLHDGIGRRKPLQGFEKWHLINDYSLSALERRSQLEGYLRRYKSCEERDGKANDLASKERPSSPHLPSRVSKWLAKAVAGPAAKPSTTQQLQGATIEVPNSNPSSSLGRAVSDFLNPERSGPGLPEGCKASGMRKRSAEEDCGDASRPRPRPSHPSSSTGHSKLRFSSLSMPDETRVANAVGASNHETNISSLGQGEPVLPNSDEWDSYGIELVSSVLQEGDEAWTTINKACNILKGKPCDHHGAKTDDICGLHVHLKPAGKDFDIPTLRHLCYILFMYEAKIDILHPQHRRATNPPVTSRSRFDFASNVGSFFGDGFATARNRILGINDPANFGNIMGVDKGLVVNFANLKRQEGKGPRTLEFRQHEGVLRGDMVKHWVLFCMGLVRLANNMGHNLMRNEDEMPVTDFDEQCRNYPFDSDDFQTMSVWDLFDLMELPRDTWDYFMKRAAYNAADPYGEGSVEPDTWDGQTEIDDGPTDSGQDSTSRELTFCSADRPSSLHTDIMDTIEGIEDDGISPTPIDPEIERRREYNLDTNDEDTPADGQIAQGPIMSKAQARIKLLHAQAAADGGQTNQNDGDDEEEDQAETEVEDGPDDEGEDGGETEGEEKDGGDDDDDEEEEGDDDTQDVANGEGDDQGDTDDPEDYLTQPRPRHRSASYHSPDEQEPDAGKEDVDDDEDEDEGAYDLETVRTRPRNYFNQHITKSRSWLGRRS